MCAFKYVSLFFECLFFTALFPFFNVLALSGRLCFLVCWGKYFVWKFIIQIWVPWNWCQQLFYELKPSPQKQTLSKLKHLNVEVLSVCLFLSHTEMWTLAPLISSLQMTELLHGTVNLISNCCHHVVSWDHYKGAAFILMQCFSCDYGSQAGNVKSFDPWKNNFWCWLIR